MPYYSGQVTYPAPLAPAQVVLRLTGPWPSPVVTQALRRYASQPRLTLRCRTQTPVTVRIERLERATWTPISTQTDAEWSTLVKASGHAVRLWVEGDSPGWVDLIETRG